MPTTIVKQVEQATPVSLLTTELNSLATNTNAAPGPAIDNAVGQSNLDGYVRAKIELVLAAYSGTPTVGSGVELWFLRTIDGGTSYEDGSSSLTPARIPDVVLPVGAVASGPQRVIKECWVPVGKFKALARNAGTGVTFAATGNTVKALLSTEEGIS